MPEQDPDRSWTEDTVQVPPVPGEILVEPATGQPPRLRLRLAGRPQKVLERDGYQCQLRYTDICVVRATQVDHIVQPEAGGGSDPANLRAVCIRCHGRRTG
jgi:5-methylcytosine-specific restriction endonuclease McrA